MHSGLSSLKTILKLYLHTVKGSYFLLKYHSSNSFQVKYLLKLAVTNFECVRFEKINFYQREN